MGKETPDALFQITMDRLRTGHGLGLPPSEVRRAGPSRIKFQTRMRKAQRIVLDRGFIRAAVAASTLSPAILAARLHLIRAPFELTWIEWDEAERLRALEEIGYGTTKKDVRGIHNRATRVGVLIETDAPTAIYRPGEDRKPIHNETPLTLMQPVILARDEKGQMIVDTCGLSMSWSEGPMPHIADRPDTMLASMQAALGSTYGEKTGVPLTPEHPLAGRVGLGAAGPFPDLLLAGLAMDRRKKTTYLMDRLIASAAGDWRFVAAVLLLWNVRGPLLESAGRSLRPGNGKPAEGDEVRIARIVLPAPTYARDGSGQGGTRTSPRLYSYGGHWCHSKKNPSKRWWRRGGQRGDASRGTVTKIYEATVRPPA